MTRVGSWLPTSNTIVEPFPLHFGPIPYSFKYNSNLFNKTNLLLEDDEKKILKNVNEVTKIVNTKEEELK